MKARDANILILPGFEPDSADVWYRRWASRISSARVLEPFDSSDLRDRRLGQLVKELRKSDKPVVLVGHGLGNISILDTAGLGADAPVAAFMVSVPDTQDPARVSSLTSGAQFQGPLPTTALGFPAVVVASQQDPYGNFEQIKSLSANWGAQFVDAGNAGAINEASGHGPWPEASLTFAAMMQKL